MNIRFERNGIIGWDIYRDTERVQNLKIGRISIIGTELPSLTIFDRANPAEVATILAKMQIIEEAIEKASRASPASDVTGDTRPIYSSPAEAQLAAQIWRSSGNPVTEIDGAAQREAGLELQSASSVAIPRRGQVQIRAGQKGQLRQDQIMNTLLLEKMRPEGVNSPVAKIVWSDKPRTPLAFLFRDSYGFIQMDSLMTLDQRRYSSGDLRRIADLMGGLACSQES